MRATLTVIALLLLATAVSLAALLHRQAGDVERSVELTGDAIESNIRTLGQAQRELLRLRIEVDADDPDADEIGLIGSFVQQRLEEATLPYQLSTLGDPGLPTLTTSLATYWSTAAVPLVERMADGATDQMTTATLVAMIDEAERELNEIIEVGELNRKSTAAEARANALDLLRTTRLIYVGMLVVGVGFVAFVAVGSYVVRRYERQRAANRAELLTLVAKTRRLSMVAALTDNLVIITDEVGRIEWVNDAFTTRSGYTLDQALGRTPGELLNGPDSDPATLAMMREHIVRGQPFNTEVINYASDGSSYWVQIDVQPVHDERGELTSFIVVQSDITERRRVEQHLRAAKEAAEGLARTKSNFLASMSHEIRTPLNALLGLTELLLTTDLDEQQREFASTAHRSGQLLLETLNNILDFSALESGRVDLDPRPFEIRAMLHRVVEILGGEADRRLLQLTATIADDVPEVVVGDPARFQQIVVNLVSNAIKFTEVGTVEVTAGWDGTAVQIVVRDTGIGIPADRLDLIFQPFSQADATISRRFGGTGLGLAISRHLAEMLGGDLTIESVEHVGTTATVTVPMTTGDAADLPVASSPELTMRRGRAPRILVAEDDPVNRRVAEHMLHKLGFRADFVHDGAAAVDACREHRYDLVLMDVQMPELDGMEATRQIRRLIPPADQPMIVALTASALVGDRERFLDAGMDGYLSKPVQLHDLAQAIDLVFANRRTGAIDPGTGRTEFESPPLDLDALRTRLGEDVDSSALTDLVDVMIPVLLGQTDHALDELRSAVARHDDAAERLVDDALESAQSVAAVALGDALRLTSAAIRSRRWTDALGSIDVAAAELERLRTWHVARSADRPVPAV